MFSWFGQLRFCLFSIPRPIDKKTQASVTPPYRKSNTASEYLLDKTATKVWCWHVVVQIRSQSRLEGPSGRHLGSSPWKSDWAHGEVPWEPGVHAPQGGKETLDPELAYMTWADTSSGQASPIIILTSQTNTHGLITCGVYWRITACIWSQ